MEKHKIFKLLFLTLASLFFVILTSMYAISINHRILKEAESSIQIHADKKTYKIFNEKIVGYYYACMKKNKENQRIYKDFGSCDEILNDAAAVEDEFLVNIPFDFYKYSWFSEHFSDKDGNVVYEMTIEDKYPTRLHCLKQFFQRILIAIPISLIFSIIFYFLLVGSKKVAEFLLKKESRKFLYFALVLGLFSLGYNFSLHLLKQSGSSGLSDINKAFIVPAGADIIFKIVIDFFSMLIIYKELKFGKPGFWFYTFCTVAVLFNPIIPIPLGLEINGFVNIFVGILLVAYLTKEYRSSIK